MNRRTVLAGVCFALPASSAGCLGSSGLSGATGDEHEPDDSATLDSPTDVPVNMGDLAEFDPERTYKEITVRSRDGVAESYRPHDVAIWNEAAEPEVGLRITESAGGSVVHHETYEIPADTTLSVSLLEPSEYRIEVRVPAAGTRHTLRVPCRFFDCNVSSTQIGVFEDGQMRSSVISTTMECPSAEC